mgnify:FL=1
MYVIHSVTYVSLEPVVSDSFSVEEEGEGTDLEDLTGEHPGENGRG